MTATSECVRWLKDAIGLDAASIGASAVERALKTREAACGLADRLVYWEHMCGSGAEQQALIEEVIVPETWFFRDRNAFAALPHVIRQEGSPAAADGVLRVLSIPCSTGEEPYSMAIVLTDTGGCAGRFHIDAVDVSARALDVARLGVYGSNSFRGSDLAFRDAHFSRRDGSRYQVADDVRRHVTFVRDNLFSSTLLADREPYDVVFCRNLLIYFDRATQDRAVDVLERLLTPHGYLFVGGSETGILLSRAFQPAKLPMAFAFRRDAARAADVADPAQTRRGTTHVPAARTAGYPVAGPARTAVRAKPPSVAWAARPSASAIADDAQQLADQGHFAEAATRCDESLRTEGPSARVFYLLALVRDATGNRTEAERYYRKALYLDPHHGEAATHLALLIERQGRAEEAAVLRRRVERIALHAEGRP